VTRERIAALGYAYVALALPAFLLGPGHRNAQSALFTGAAFAFLWFLASLRARLVRYDPDGFFVGVVVLGGAALHGGEGTLYNSVIGVFIMVVLGNSLNLLNVDSYWQRVAVGAVIVAAAAADRFRKR